MLDILPLGKDLAMRYCVTNTVNMADQDEEVEVNKKNFCTHLY